MKAFLNKAKALLKTVTVNVTAWTIIGTVVALGVVTVISIGIKNKVRGAISWIADKYNGMVTKFKTVVTEDTAEA